MRLVWRYFPVFVPAGGNTLRRDPSDHLYRRRLGLPSRQLPESSIYDGEFTDGSMELPGLDVFGGEKDGGWTAAKCSGLGIEKLSPRLSPAITYQEAIPVVEVIHTPAGETVFDFGQELTGWVEFVLPCP